MILELSLFVNLLIATNAENIYIKHVRCNFSNEFVYKNISCFAKSYNRQVSTVNYMIMFKKPIEKLFVEGTLFYRYGQTFHEVMKFKKINWCQLMDKSVENIVYAYLIDEIRNSEARNMIHKCPYKDFIVSNASFVISPILAQFATGEYKGTLRFFKNEDKDYGIITLFGSIVTPNKDTFG